MRLKRIFTLGLFIVFALTALTACSKHKKAADAATNNFDANSIIGKVTDISGSKITIALYEMPDRGERSKDGQDNGAGPSGAPDWRNKDRGDENQGDSESPSGAPGRSRNSNGSDVSGTPGAKGKENRQGGRNGFFKETGETKTIDITDESLIKIRSGKDESQGSLKDISVDSMVTVQYEEDGSTIRAIIVQGQWGNDSDEDARF